MRTFAPVLLAIAGITGSSPALAVETSTGAAMLSFRDVLERVRANNEALLAARAGVDVADGEVRRAWVGWKPVVNATGSVLFNSAEQTIDPALYGQPGELIVIQPHVQGTGLLAVSQTLFDLAVLRRPAVAKASRRAAIARAEATEDDLMFQAATMYATLGGLKALETSADRALAVAEQRVRDARLQLDAGTTTPLSLTRAEADRVTARGQKASLRARRRGMLANLRALIAAAGDIDIRGERLGEYVKGQPGGFEQRSIIASKVAELEAAEKTIGLSDMGWMPRLNAEGQLRYTNAQGFSTDPFNATASINLVLPLYDGGARYADTDVAEGRAAEARHRLEQERLTARAYLEESSANIDSAKAELEQAEAQLKLSEEAVRQAEDLARHGLATNLELSDADSKRFTADRSIVQKQLDYDLALLRAFYASGGRLLPDAGGGRQPD